MENGTRFSYDARAAQGAGRPSRRTLLGIAAYTVVILLVAFWAGFELFGWARDRIGTSLPEFNETVLPAGLESPAAEGEADVAAAVEQPAVESVAPVPRATPINVLLMGTDERPNEGIPLRTDTLILATLDPESQTAGMLSLPRDLWVPIPGLGYPTKINTAYGIGQTQGYEGGGAQLVMDTVSSFVGQPVPYFVRINFNGFTQLIDLIGGIDITVPKTIHDEAFPLPNDEGVETFHLDAGYQHMDGATALKYARTRNVDDDYGRSGRQQEVIRAVYERVFSAQMIPTLLANAPRLLSTLRSSVETNVPLDKLLEWAAQMNASPPREIRQLVLDARYGEETYSPEGMWILLPDRDKVRAAVNAFFTPPAADNSDAVAAATAAANPSDVHLEVLNGTGTAGMAALTRDVLVAQGYQVVSIGDADRGDYAQSILINYGVSDAVLQQVSNALGMQPALASVSGLNEDTHVDLRLILGQDVLPFLLAQ